MTKPRVLLVVDRPGWAFHRIASQIATRLTDEFRFQIVPADLLRSADCDIAVALWWRAHPKIIQETNAKSVVLCLYDHVSWCKSLIDIREFEEALGKSQALVVSNAALLERVRQSEYLHQPTFICEDGVNAQLFVPQPLPSEFTIGWAGDSGAGYGSIKGLGIIVEACEQTQTKLVIADKANGSSRPFEEMPHWYGGISCYVCASSAEGTPNPPLEAMACGRPVITTRVGIMDRVVQHGVNGYFVERDAESMAKAIRVMRHSNLQRMGHMARVSAEAHDWAVKISAWRTALHSATQSLECQPEIPKPRRAVKPGSRPRFLLVADVRGWAFDVNERDCAEYLSEWFDFDHYYVGERLAPPSMHGYQGVFLPFHNWGLDHYWRDVPILGSLRSADFDNDKPGELAPWYAGQIARSVGFHVVTREAFTRWRERFPQLVYLTNPVNMRRFAESTQVNEIVCSWNGNASHASSRQRDVKGFHKVIAPACKAIGVPLETLEYGTNRKSPEEMPAFYRRASVALCASAYEGASNSVMEAMASGLALIATDVGNHREMHESQLQHFGDSGILLCERNAAAFAAAIKSITPERARVMGQLNRAEIAWRWSWDAWRDRYKAFFERAL